MATQTAQQAPLESLAYAESLYSYAAQRLDAFSLRCWVIQRLMADDGLEHPSAEELFERVLASALKNGEALESRRILRERRHVSFRELRSRTNDRARRRLHLGPTGHACA